jgi:Xaa-Pro aminopeptidase
VTLRVHAAEFNGKSVAEKLVDIRAELAANHVDYLVVSPLDEVAWLFNVRGGDLAYNPVNPKPYTLNPQPQTLHPKP